MLDITIDRMASDLGILHYSAEPQHLYRNRVLYSAMASWIKAIAMDQSAGSREEGFAGVSRRHLFERSRIILDTFCNMYSGAAEWFDLAKSEEHPAVLIRTRLLNHGDLLNEGFDTNLALSATYSKQLTSSVETVYGKVLGNNLQYCGIATLRKHEDKPPALDLEDTGTWLDEFVRDAWWSSSFPDANRMQYFNPFSPVKNNFSAWQDLIPETVYGLTFARTTVNKYGYEYFLIKDKDKLIHKLDPFLQELGYPIRIMCALRNAAGNAVMASVRDYDDHVSIRLNTYLPLRENGLLESYAWPERHINDRLKWIIDLSLWDYIRTYIEALGIQIVEDSDG